MRRAKTVIIALSLVGVLLLPACHGGTSTAKMRWVNQADADQMMEFTVQTPSVLGRVHMAFMRSRVTVRGTYVLRKAETVLEEGTLVQEPDAYILKSKDGKEQHLKLEKPESLKSEIGTIWNLRNPATVSATLREW